MSMRSLPNMSKLVQRLLDDQIQPDEMERLQEAILKDPQVSRYHLDSMFVKWSVSKPYDRVAGGSSLLVIPIIRSAFACEYVQTYLSHAG
jgi:hypothetical protein